MKERFKKMIGKFIPSESTVKAIFHILGICYAYVVTFVLVGFIVADRWQVDTLKEYKDENRKLRLEKQDLNIRVGGFIITQSYNVFMSEINPDISIKDANQIIASVRDNYEKTGLSMADLISICSHESTLNKKALNPDNTGIGLCQINPSTFNQYKKQGVFKEDIKKLYEIQYNVHVATEILKEHRKVLERKYNITMFSLKGEVDEHVRSQYKNFIDRILISSYNTGTRNADSQSDYVDKVMEIKERL